MRILTIPLVCAIALCSARPNDDENLGGGRSDETETGPSTSTEWSMSFRRVTGDTRVATTDQPTGTHPQTTQVPPSLEATPKIVQASTDALPTVDYAAIAESSLAAIPHSSVAQSQSTDTDHHNETSPSTGSGQLRIVHEHTSTQSIPTSSSGVHSHDENQTDLFTLTILHTNDVHARFLSFNDQGRPCSPKNLQSNICWGGAARRQTAMKKFMAKDKNVLKLDGGDQFQGTLWYTALKWEPIAQYMNIMNYDAMVFGNHEFDDGMVGLEPFVRNMSTPIVSSNIEDSGSPIKDLFHRKLIKEVDGQKIGIVGCTTTEVPQVAKPGPKLQFIDEVRAVQAVVDELKSQGINKIIVLSHAGIKKERKICQQVRGVDVVVGGHSHTFLYSGKQTVLEVPEGPYPEVYGNGEGNNTCLVVQDYAYGKYLGRLKVFFDQEGHVVSWKGSPVPLDANTFPEDAEIARLLSPYQKQLAHFQKTIVAETAVKLDGNRKSCRVRECNMGNLLADAALYFYVKRQFEVNQANSSQDIAWSPAAISILNSGGVRDYEATPGSNVTLEDLYTMMPFGNTIDKLTVKGTVLKEAFEHAVAKYVETLDDPEGRFLQVSGVKVVYDLTKPVGQRVQSLKIRCNKCGVPSYHPVDLDELYDVVTQTYVSSGGDGYTMLRDKKVSSDGSNMLDVDVVMDYMKSYRPLLTGEELRIEWEQGNGQIDKIPPQLAEFHAGRK